MNDELRNMNEDWVEVELGEVLEIERGGSPRPIKEYITDDEDGINWIKIGDTKGISKYITKTAQKIKPSGLKKSRMVYPNDFILSNSMSFGKPYIMNTEGAIHDGWLVLRDSYNILNKDFLYYALSSPIVYNQFSKLATGSTVKNLNIRLVQRVKIIFRPIPEQLVIAKKIESLFSDLDNGIANLKKAQEQLKIYRQAVLKKAFEGELTKEWREKRITNYELGITNEKLPTAEELLKQIKEERQKNYELRITNWEKAVKEWKKNKLITNDELRITNKKPTKPKAIKELPPLTEDELKKLPKLPEGWIKTQMENISIDITDGDHQAPPKSDKGIPFITISNIKENRIDFSKTFFVDDNYYNSLINYRIPRNGDVLYTVTGSFGIPVLIDFDIKFCFQRHIGLIRPLSLTNSKWLYYLLLTKLIYNQAVKKATGTAQKTIGLASIRNFITPICSISEQHQIVSEIESRLSVTDNLEFVISNSLQKAKALRQSILKKAFEGKLLSEAEIEACKQEEDYEPSSVLLARIERSRNEKIKAGKVKTQNSASQRKTKNKAKK